jgi:hypothetical protein
VGRRKERPGFVERAVGELPADDLEGLCGVFPLDYSGGIAA